MVRPSSYDKTGGVVLSYTLCLDEQPLTIWGQTVIWNLFFHSRFQAEIRKQLRVSNNTTIQKYMKTGFWKDKTGQHWVSGKAFSKFDLNTVGSLKNMSLCKKTEKQQNQLQECRAEIKAWVSLNFLHFNELKTDIWFKN